MAPHREEPQIRAGEASRFKPGVSGNPGGRPKAVRELLERARLAVPAALEFAEGLLGNVAEDARVRLEAAKFLTAYGLGAPPKEVTQDPSEQMSDEELQSAVARMLAERGKSTPH